MVPYSYNMVNMGGIDLAEANGTVVPGVYEKIVEAMNLCGDLILYNWKFAEIDITPSAYTVLQQAHSILINGLIQVTELDQITVIGLPPPIVPVSPLDVTANGTYEADPPVSGFNPVRVVVPLPVIAPLAVSSNGVYPTPAGVDGFNPVNVEVPERVPIIESLSITENGLYSAPEGVDGFSPISVNVGGIEPDWRTFINYIESSGTQYIDTGYLPNDNTNVEIIASVSRGINSYPTIFGVRPQAYSQAGTHDFLIHFYSNTDRGTLFEWNTGVAVLPYLNLVDKKTRYKFGANWYSAENDAYMSGSATQPSGSILGAYSLYIFNFNYMGSSFGRDAACIMKLYCFRIYEGTTLVHEYIPWQNNGVACLKDTVTETILYNAGTGDFVYGTDQ